MQLAPSLHFSAGRHLWVLGVCVCVSARNHPMGPPSARQQGLPRGPRPPHRAHLRPQARVFTRLLEGMMAQGSVLSPPPGLPFALQREVMVSP